MQISTNFSVSGIDAARSANRATPNEKPQTTNASNGINAPVDQLDLSPEALSLNDTSEVFRSDKVAQMRDAIAAGNYDTDEKLSVALDRMLDHLG
jgi:anti-sigma28 factor (negative regulator of flagellin synthesis)